MPVTILLVDDDLNTREIYGFMLKRLGHHVIEAADGRDAIQAAVTFSPDAILMDIRMPHADGLATVAALRSISRFQHVPIVAVTAYPHDISQRQAIEAGFDAYLEKPLTKGEKKANITLQCCSPSFSLRVLQRRQRARRAGGKALLRWLSARPPGRYWRRSAGCRTSNFQPKRSSRRCRIRGCRSDGR